MKVPHRLFLLPALVLPLLAGPVVGATPEAGKVDFSPFAPGGTRSRVVEVNLDSNLIGLVARFAGNEEPELAELLKNLRKVKVNVVGVDDSNRSAVGKQLAEVRGHLDAEGWSRVVLVKDTHQDVAVHLRADGDRVIQGIVVTVQNGGDEAVFVNVVGNIRPEQLAEIGERFDIEPLRHVGKAVHAKPGSDTDAKP